MSIKDALSKAKKEKKLVSIFTDKDDWDDWSVGYVDILTDQHVRLHSLSRYGDFAGYIMMNLSEIIKVEVDSQYEKKMERFHSSQENFFAEVKLENEIEVNIIIDALKASLNDKTFIEVWGNDPEVSLGGYVEDMDEETVTVHLIDSYGVDDGVSTIKINEIRRLDFNTRCEQARRFLYNSNGDR